MGLFRRDHVEKMQDATRDVRAAARSSGAPEPAAPEPVRRGTVLRLTQAYMEREDQSRTEGPAFEKAAGRYLAELETATPAEIQAASDALSRNGY